MNEPTETTSAPTETTAETTTHHPDDAPLWMQFAAAIAGGQTASGRSYADDPAAYSSEIVALSRAFMAEQCAGRADAMLVEYRKRFQHRIPPGSGIWLGLIPIDQT
jgi:hypothetical protein